jgi:RNA polymerase sigma-70 factor, ECF subfamily
MAEASIVQAYLEAIDDPARRNDLDPERLDEALRGAIDAAQAAWPDVRFDPIALSGHLGRHAPPDASFDEGWARLRPIEIGLAFACGRGDDKALAHFERVFSPTIDAVLRRFRNVPTPADDLVQLLRERLFVGGGKPKILDYSGQGFLENWLRVTALRTFTDAARAAPKRESAFPDALLEVDDGEDVELAFLKRHYRSEFKEAFEQAVVTLESGTRNLLRQSVVQRLNIDQIGALYGVHRATAARRLERAKEDLLVATRTRLMERLAVDRDELESIMGLIRSRLDVSVGRVLQKSDG